MVHRQLFYHLSHRTFVDMENREKEDSQSVHVINIDIQDNHEDATIGAFMVCDLCTLVRSIYLYSLILWKLKYYLT